MPVINRIVIWTHSRGRNPPGHVPKLLLVHDLSWKNHKNSSPSSSVIWHFKRDWIPCLKSQKTVRTRLFQLYRDPLRPLDSGKAGASCLAVLQGLATEAPRALAAGYPWSQNLEAEPAASQDCLVRALVRGWACQKGPECCPSCRWDLSNSSFKRECCSPAFGPVAAMAPWLPARSQLLPPLKVPGGRPQMPLQWCLPSEQ